MQEVHTDYEDPRFIGTGALFFPRDCATILRRSQV